MQLYQKIQELITLNEQLQDDNTKTLEYAKDTLKSYANELIQEEEQRLATELKEDLQNQSQIVQNNLQESLRGEFIHATPALIESIKSTIDLQALQDSIIAHATQVYASSLEASFSAYIEQNCQNLLQNHAQNLLESQKEQLRALLESQGEAIAQEIIKKLDYSFLSEQPQAFYDAIVNSIGELITRKIEQGYLQEQFMAMGSKIYKQITSLQELKEIELQSQLYLMGLSAKSELESLENALKITSELIAQENALKAQITQENAKYELENLKLQNAIKLEKERKEALENGSLPQEQITQKSYKVI